MTRPTSTRGAPLPTARLSILALWALLALLSAAPAAAEQELEARLPVRVIAGRLLVRCELSTRFRRIPANLFVDIERPCGLELHNRAAHFIKVDEEGGVPITIHLPGRDITVERRGHGDEDLFDQFTRLHSKELGETACIGAIGSEIFAGHKTTLDLNAGLVRLRPPREIGGAPPEEIEGSIVTGITLVNDLVWFPVRLADGRILNIGLGTTRHDTIIDRDLCDELGAPAGDIGAVKLKTVDLSRHVAFRPEELIQVHPDGALGMTGLHLLEHFRVEVDRVNRTIRFTETAPADFPEEDLAFFRAMVEEEREPLVGFLEEHPDARLARECAELLLDRLLEEEAGTADFQVALEWIDRTRIEDLRATEALITMKALTEARRPGVAILAGKIGIESGRKDRYPESIHHLHRRLGELLLDRGNGPQAWEHLLSAAFGLPDDGKVSLLLGRYYEQEKRYKRAMSRYIQAVIAPESGPQAVEGLERVQARMGGEPLSVDLVDRLVAGKVHSFTAATRFEESEETRTDRVALAELFTNAHLGRRLREGWRSFAVGGAMACEGLLSHFPRERLAVLVHHIDVPEPTALMNPLSMSAAKAYGIDAPVVFRINGVHEGPGASRWRQAEEVYGRNRTIVIEELKRPSRHEIEAVARIDEGVVSGSVTARGPQQANLVVQIILAERGVLYPGKAKVVVHRMVARAALTEDLAGIPYEPADGAMTIPFSRTLSEITADNEEFLEGYEAAGGGAASRLSTEIDARQVSIVAFIRDLSTMEVLQAVQIDPEGAAPEGRP